jgi:hypothetical protein
LKFTAVSIGVIEQLFKHDELEYMSFPSQLGTLSLSLSRGEAESWRLISDKRVWSALWVRSQAEVGAATACAFRRACSFSQP